nr:uncharacterized protein LOC115258677 [Aedes albopictus]XP_029727569.1 uncharacterized protein LOC115265759 [Aedes albopictus]XP_029727570.1 uncharacterized protein LOC115265759 [Aedes albopictus]XP_029732152.1 uncharacterized protein LOC109419425 [Aedes albopictus]
MFRGPEWDASQIENACVKASKRHCSSSRNGQSWESRCRCRMLLGQAWSCIFKIQRAPKFQKKVKASKDPIIVELFCDVVRIMPDGEQKLKIKLVLLGRSGAGLRCDFSSC